MKSAKEVYRGVRDGQSGLVGERWEGLGVYLGDDGWGDPEVLGLPGEYDRMQRATPPGSTAGKEVPSQVERGDGDTLVEPG
jgi:hypothetical protein